MPVIPLDGIPLRHIPIVTAFTKKSMDDLLRSKQLVEGLHGAQWPSRANIAEAYTTFNGRLWILARQGVAATDHCGHTIRNVRHVFTRNPAAPWWSLPIRPGERAYEFDPATGGPAAGSGRPYPHPVLPPEIAAVEAERCGPYRDAFGLCTGCGLRGRVQRRCTVDDPDRSADSKRTPHAQPWKWVPCPHGCSYVDQPEIRPSKLYELTSLLAVTN